MKRSAFSSIDSGLSVVINTCSELCSGLFGQEVWVKYWAVFCNLRGGRNGFMVSAKQDVICWVLETWNYIFILLVPTGLTALRSQLAQVAWEGTFFCWTLKLCELYGLWVKPGPSYQHWFDAFFILLVCMYVWVLFWFFFFLPVFLTPFFCIPWSRTAGAWGWWWGGCRIISEISAFLFPQVPSGLVLLRGLSYWVCFWLEWP